MPPAPKRRRLNGARRRQPKRNVLVVTTSNARWMHLSQAEVGFQSTVQTGIAVRCACAVLGVLHYDLSTPFVCWFIFFNDWLLFFEPFSTEILLHSQQPTRPDALELINKYSTTYYRVNTYYFNYMNRSIDRSYWIIFCTISLLWRRHDRWVWEMRSRCFSWKK
jgi:hypothetical protein